VSGKNGDKDKPCDNSMMLGTRYYFIKKILREMKVMDEGGLTIVALYGLFTASILHFKRLDISPRSPSEHGTLAKINQLSCNSPTEKQTPHCKLTRVIAL
jgi:hypothetical protein